MPQLPEVDARGASVAPVARWLDNWVAGRLARWARRALVVASASVLLLAADPSVRAEGDPRAEARVLYFDGKFREAEDLLTKAGPEISKDPALRTQLVEAAQKFLRGKTGEERRAGVEAIKRCWAAVVEADPTAGDAVCKAILAAKELAELDLAKHKNDDAKAQATWALQLGEKAAGGGLTPETKAALGAAYGLRASVTRKVELVDQACLDYAKGAQMLEEAAAGSPQESERLAQAAELRLGQAVWIHDSIPLEKEKRDDEAITAAIGLAKRACEAKGATDDTYVMHIRALCTAHDWKLPGDHGKPFMEPLAPAYEGLSLLVPKGARWKRVEKTTEWDVILERCYDPTDSSVQILLTANSTKSSIGAKTWNDVEEAVATMADKRKGGYSDVASELAPVRYGDKKKGPQLWHFELAGTVANSSRRNKMGEWIWPSTTRKDTVWDLRIIDWRNSPSLDDPDIVAFVNSAIPPGWWPPGSAPPADPKGKKPGGKKK